MSICVIYNADVSTSAQRVIKSVLGSDVKYFKITSSSVPEIRKQWTKEVAPQVYRGYSKCLVIGEKLTEVIVPFLTKKEHDGQDKVKIDTYHGCLVEQDGLLFMPVYAAVTSITEAYLQRDVERFVKASSVPALPEVVDYYLPTDCQYLYLDIETTGLKWASDRITSIQLCFDDGAPVYIAEPTKYVLTEIAQYVQRTGCTVVGHNLMFDLSFLSIATGVNWFVFPLIDTMLLSKARGSHINNLKHLASVLDCSCHPLSYKRVGEYNKEYAVADVLVTREVHQQLTAKGLRPIDILSAESLQTFGSARLAGLYINRNKLDETYTELVKQVKALADKLWCFDEIEWANNNQVAEALIGLGVPLREKTPTGKYAVGKEVLIGLSETYEVVATLLEWRELNKELKDFYKKYKNTIVGDYIHPTVNVLGTTTGRTSCSDPNAQQIPLSVKKIFTSRFDGGKMGVFDLDRSELVCAVLLSGDEAMAEALLKYDYHKYVASLAFRVAYGEVTKEQRSIAKTLTFGALMYGGSAKGISNKTGVDAKLLEDAVISLKKGFSKLTAFQERYIQRAFNNLRISDAFGKVRDLRLEKEYKGMGAVKRDAMNTPIQALSGYVCLLLCNYCQKQFWATTMQSIVVLNVHDEVIIDVHPDEVEAVQKIVKDAFDYLGTVPELNSLPGWHLIQPTGELVIADSWYDCKVG